MVKLFTSLKRYIKKPISHNSYSREKYHIYILIILIILIAIGLHVILSATPIMAQVRFSNPYMFVSNHILYIFIGLFMFMITGFFIDYKKYQKFSRYIYLLAIILLTIVLFFGEERKGAARWINLGFITFQPSEFAKIALMIVMSDFLARKQRIINDLATLVMPIFYLLFMAFFIITQKDLGTCILLSWVWLAMMFISGLSFKKIFSAIIFIIFFSAFFILKQPYRVKRMIDYINSIFDISLASFNIKSSLVAFGSGGLFGKGAGQSEMKLLHLPEMHTDFIFPIIGEEYGFIGVLIIISLFIWLLLTGISISRNCDDEFGKYLSVAIVVMITTQACINMAMTTGVFPAKGMPLPFISYGGSSMIISMIMMGILFNIARSNKK